MARGYERRGCPSCMKSTWAPRIRIFVGMSLARTEVSRPQYFGGDLRTYRTASDLRLSEVDYGSARRWAPHTHWRAFFALLLRGRYVETVGRSQLGYSPLDLGFHPEYLQHADRIAADDT